MKPVQIAVVCVLLVVLTAGAGIPTSEQMLRQRLQRLYDDAEVVRLMNLPRLGSAEGLDLSVSNVDIGEQLAYDDAVTFCILVTVSPDDGTAVRRTIGKELFNYRKAGNK